MTEPRRTPTPKDGPDEADPVETTSVRPRAAAAARHPESGEWPAFGNIYDPFELVRSAKVLLAELPANHPRAQLLRTAIVRRDEIVLVRLIEELRAAKR